MPAGAAATTTPTATPSRSRLYSSPSLARSIGPGAVGPRPARASAARRQAPRRALPRHRPPHREASRRSTAVHGSQRGGGGRVAPRTASVQLGRVAVGQRVHVYAPPRPGRGWGSWGRGRLPSWGSPTGRCCFLICSCVTRSVTKTPRDHSQRTGLDETRTPKSPWSSRRSRHC
jgi:hypothetical protein